MAQAPDFWRHWVREPLTGARLWALHHALRALPTEAASGLGGGLGRRLGPRLHPQLDARMRDTARRLRPDLARDAAALDHIVTGAWDSIGRAFAEFSVEHRLLDEGRVEVDGAERLAAARESGRPIVVARLHLANWEVVPIALAALGLPLVYAYQPQPNRFRTALAVAARERSRRAVARRLGVAPEAVARGIMPSPRAGAEILRALRGGFALALHVDEQVDGKVYAPAFRPPPPLRDNVLRICRLVRLTQAIVLPAYAERTGGARFRVHVGAPIAMPTLSDQAEDLRAKAAALNERLRTPVLDHLDQWFMLPYYRLRK